MTISILIAATFFLAFFFESIFGFGGMVISFTILSFFIDVKDIIPIGIFVGISASIVVLITDRKSINWPILLKEVFPIAFLGTISGVILFGQFQSELLLKIFGLFLMVVSIISLFFNKLIISKYIKIPLIYIGGVMQGIYGTGGPLTILAVKDSLQNKSQLRSTFALYFIIFNIVRMGQFHYMGNIEIYEVFSCWWLVFPIFLAVFLGYRIHIKVSEEIFKKIINFLLLIAAIIYII